MATPPLQKANTQSRLPSQEMLLLDYVRKLEKHRSGRLAVHVHIAALQPMNRREHHLRIAANSFEPMVKMTKGQLFQMGNGDMIFIYKDIAADEVEAAVVKLKFLFSDDPLLSDNIGEHRRGTFCTWFNLEREYDRVLVLAQKLAQADRDRRAAGDQEQVAAAGTQTRRPVGEPLTPELLARVEQALSQADLSNMMRRQAVCAIVGRAPPQPVFNELFISIADLRETLLPRVNLASSPWLFQHLTETLDKRVLSLLSKQDDRTLAGDISINLNVGTLISPEFLTFDDNVRASMRSTIVLELNKIDIFADIGAFIFARDFAHDRGYRVCVDGITYQALPFVDRERLGVDLIKLQWDPKMRGAVLPDGRTLAEIVKKYGASRMILCRCDDQDAVDYGQEVGITLFQGRHVENMLYEEQKKRGGIPLHRRR